MQVRTYLAVVLLIRARVVVVILIHGSVVSLLLGGSGLALALVLGDALRSSGVLRKGSVVLVRHVGGLGGWYEVKCRLTRCGTEACEKGKKQLRGERWG
jgi:hypothetical protein